MPSLVGTDIAGRIPGTELAITKTVSFVSVKIPDMARKIVPFIPKTETLEVTAMLQKLKQNKVLVQALKLEEEEAKVKVKYIQGPGSPARLEELQKKYPDVQKFIFRGFHHPLPGKY